MCALNYICIANYYDLLLIKLYNIASYNKCIEGLPATYVQAARKNLISTKFNYEWVLATYKIKLLRNY